MQLRPLVLGLVAASALAARPAQAQPPALYGVAHLGNESRARATVYYKWGDGPWRQAVLQRGQKVAFPYAYDGPTRTSPPLLVRIDVDTDGARFVEHLLSRGASPDDNSARYGHHFIIRQLAGADTRYIAAASAGATVRVTDAHSFRP